MSLFEIFCIICVVESGCSGPNPAQITKICERDVGVEAVDVRSSFLVFRKYVRKYDGKGLEDIAALWNGGPSRNCKPYYLNRIRNAVNVRDWAVMEMQQQLIKENRKWNRKSSIPNRRFQIATK